jgi:hypothetical protein
VITFSQQSGISKSSGTLFRVPGEHFDETSYRRHKYVKGAVIHRVSHGGLMELEFVELSAELEVELKYCERCGGLWLRPVGGRQIYCPPCIPKMAHMPFRGAKHKSDNFFGREGEGIGKHAGGPGIEILAFCPEGGNA